MVLNFLKILFLSTSIISSSLCANSVINHDIQKINSAYVVESCFEELEELLQKDEFLDYKKQFEDNLVIEDYLEHEEVVELSKNYKYKKFIEVHSIQDIDVILCTIVQLDNDNRVTYVYPYTISLNNSWKSVAMPYDIIELTYSTEIMVCSIGEYYGKNSLIAEAEPIYSFFTIEHDLQKNDNSWTQVKGTHVDFANKRFKIECEKNRLTALGSKRDLENWINKLEATKDQIAFLLVGDMSDKEYTINSNDIKRVLDFLYHAKLDIFTEFENPSTGGNTIVIALDKDNNILWHIYYDDYWFVDLTEEKKFVFNGKRVGLFPVLDNAPPE